MWCLIDIVKEYPYAVYEEEDKFERIIEMIKESGLKGSEYDEIIKLTEKAIEDIKSRKMSDI